MVKTYDEYLKLLEAELNKNMFMSESEIESFIRKNQLDKSHGIDVGDVKSDIKTILSLHNQGKKASSTSANNNSNYSTTSMNSSNSTIKNQLLGLSGKVYSIDTKPFSSGGEGDIYSIVNDKTQVVKIYHSDRITDELERKLRYMAQNPPASSVLNQVAWPIDVIYDGQKRFKGFVMPKLDITNELGEIYVYPPKIGITYEQKTILAQNICAVIHEVHKAGYVFGDFNPRNIGVNLKKGTVAFLDTDSYHIIDGNNVFRCKVCLDGYVAPELLAKCESFKNDAYAVAPLPTFTKETDYFALAIHIFKLLMNGYTPFNGIKENETVSTANPGVGNQAIKRNNYCFKPGNKPQAVVVPELKSLPDDIQKLFSRAFIDGKNNPSRRPSALEWYKALEKYQGNLKKCSSNKTHMYFKSLKSCPLCEADKRYQNNLNPMLTQKTFASPVSGVPVSMPVYAPTSASSTIVATPTSSASMSQSYVSGRPATLRKKTTSGINSLATWLYVFAWLFFVAVIVIVAWPFLKSGNFSFKDTVIMQLNIKRDPIITGIAIAMLCFTAYFKDSPRRGLANTFAGIWSAIICFVIPSAGFASRGYYVNSASQAWATFGTLITVYVLLNVFGSKFGAYLNEVIIKKSRKAGKKVQYRPFDIFLIICFAIASLVCIPFLLNIYRFYDACSSFNLIRFLVFIIPVVFCILFYSANSGSSAVEGWYCASMVTAFTLALLIVAGIKDLGGMIFAWIGVAILGLIVCCILGNEIGTGVSGFAIAMIILIHLVGAYLGLSTIGEGLSGIGVGAKLWMTAPAIIAMIIATIETGKELLRHKIP